ncbi:MAG: methyltransferase [Frankiales bacterium]|nr:methyltransferase [Frankiales bacterium]
MSPSLPAPGPELWSAVDAYIVGALLPPDAGLTGALERSQAAGLPAIAVAPNQGKLLHLLARMIGAGQILEVGTLGGYSTIWLARALPPSGRLVTLELDPAHAAVARENIEAAGLSDRVEVRVGAALDTLAELTEPIDLAFIDADKANNPRYVEHALRLSHPGTVIVIDNTVRGGRVADAESTDADVVGTRALHDLLAADPRVDATTIQTVGSKGHDGLTIALVS